MSINNQKVVVGGLAAGVTFFVLDFLSNLLISGGRWEAEMQALNPTVAANLREPATVVGFVIVDVLLGIMLTWLYAAIRPHFGPGPKTAMIAALFFFLATGAVWASYPVMGLITWGAWGIGGVGWIINCFASAYVGGLLYKDSTASATGQA